VRTVKRFVLSFQALALLSSALAAVALLATTQVGAQQTASQPAASNSSPAQADANEALETADQILADMSKLLSLPVLHPLKKSVRSRTQIREYLVRTMQDDKDNEKRYADRKALEKLSLIPKGYPLEEKMLALLTEQIAGLYDPKGREFFIADWTASADQNMIMAHELTHALQDQHFQIEQWEKSAKPNDDATLARDAVLEGSAVVSMLDYVLRDTGKTTRDVPAFDPSLLVGDVDDSPEFAKAPPALRDEMLFPYTAGAGFMLHLLRNWSGAWSDLHKIFENPPKSTQQILHPELYLRGVEPVKVALPAISKLLPRGWKQLDESTLGEFGLREVLKQFLDAGRATDLAAGWAGDHYGIFEQQPGGRTLLVMRFAFQSDAAAARYFGAYSEVLEKKIDTRSELLRRPNFFSFQAADGGIFLRCFANECLSAEGTTRAIFDSMTAQIGWPAGPVDPRAPRNRGLVAELTVEGATVNFGPVASHSQTANFSPQIQPQ
jgi:hypothetical protein